MINFRFIISTLLLIAISIATPTFAGEYRVIVLPNSTIDVSHKNKINNVDIEEMLSKKIISRLEEQGLACAPTLDILRIGIINNPYYSTKASNPMNNAKIISKSYNVSKVLLVSSKVVIKNSNKQKEFWRSMNIPALTSQDPETRIVTTVTMYDTKTDQAIWSDVYQHNLHKTDVKSIKIAKVNSYYDTLTDKMLEDLKTTTSTSAILISKNNVPIPEWGKGGKYITQRAVGTKNIKDVKTVAEASDVEMVHQKITKVKLIKHTQSGFIQKMQNGINKKYLAIRNYREQREIERANKIVQESNKTVKENKKLLQNKQNKIVKKNDNNKITKTEKPKTNKLSFLNKANKTQEKKIADKKISNNKIAEKKSPDKKVSANKPKLAFIKLKNNKNKTAKVKAPKVAEKKSGSIGKTISASFSKTKQNLHNFVANMKVKKTGKVAKENNQQNKPQKQLKQQEKKKIFALNFKKHSSVKTAKNKTVQPKQTKAKTAIGTKINNSIKGKYTQVKQAYIEKRNKQIQQDKKEQHYTTVIAPVTGEENSINNYIQIKPRNNSWNYTPHFNSLVNDI